MTNLVQDLFSRRLKRLRRKKGVTMVEVADTIGMSQATISEWEKGNKFPRAGALQQLANYFNVPMEYFFKENAFPTVDLVNIPFYMSISAAALSIIEGISDDGVEFIKIPTNFLKDYLGEEGVIAFTMEQDRMDLLFPSESTVVAKAVEQDEVKDDDIVVYFFNDEYTVGRFRRNELQKVVIFSPESTNKNHYDIVIPLTAEQDVKIIAKVIWYGVSI